MPSCLKNPELRDSFTEGRKYDQYSFSSKKFTASGLDHFQKRNDKSTQARRKFIRTHATSTSDRAHQDLAEKESLS
jgi:hypothetical protein